MRSSPDIWTTRGKTALKTYPSLPRFREVRDMTWRTSLAPVPDWIFKQARIFYRSEPLSCARIFYRTCALSGRQSPRNHRNLCPSSPSLSGLFAHTFNPEAACSSNHLFLPFVTLKIITVMNLEWLGTVLSLLHSRSMPAPKYLLKPARFG